MRIANVLLSLLATAVLLTGCDPNTADGTRQSLAGTPYPGLWLEKKDAIELRSTGKMESYCPEIKAQPDRQISNVRLIEPSGDIYSHHPYAPKGKIMQIGVLRPNGKIETVGAINQFLKGRNMIASIKDDTLNLKIEDSVGDGIEYVRTTKSELTQYFAALAACKN